MGVPGVHGSAGRHESAGGRRWLFPALSLVFDETLVVPDTERSLEGGAILPWRRGGKRMIVYYKSMLRAVAAQGGVSLDTPYKELPQEISLCLFRVLQEALQNATKHSGSRHFEVSLIGALNELHLTVRDLGIGFDLKDAVKGRGIGLISMKERLELVGGQLSIESQPQHGMTIQARVALSSG